MFEPNLEITLTHENEADCFKLLFQVRPGPHALQRQPVEIDLDPVQAVGLFKKLAAQLSRYTGRPVPQLLKSRRATLEEEAERVAVASVSPQSAASDLPAADLGLPPIHHA